MEMHSLIAELYANHEQPCGEDKAQLAVGQARSESASGDSAEEPADEELQQQCCIEVLAEEVQSPSDEREA